MRVWGPARRSTALLAQRRCPARRSTDQDTRLGALAMPSLAADPRAGAADVARRLEPFDLLGELPTGTTLLEASAGTGKTFAVGALVARYVAEGHGARSTRCW